MTKDRILAAGGLDAMLAATRKPLPPRLVPQGGTCPYPDVSTYQWVTGGWAIATSSGVGNQGGQTSMTIAQPSIVPGTYDHSLSETWTIGDSGCTVQTVEAGWTVDHIVNGDYLPHVFLFATASTYGATGTTGATGCYNDNPAFGQCVTWIPATGAALYPGAPLTAIAQPGGPQHEVAVATSHFGRNVCRVTGCVWVWEGWLVRMAIDGGAWVTLGYYANSAFGTGPLATAASEFQVGSEVDDSVGNANVQPGAPPVTMGEASIHDYSGGSYGANAYFHDFSLYGPASSTPAGPVAAFVGQGTQAPQCAPFSLPGPSHKVCTYVQSKATPGSSSWANWFYYGDWAPCVATKGHLCPGG